MAKATIKMPDDYLIKLSSLGNRTDDITEKMLKSGGKVMLESVSLKLDSVIGKNIRFESRSTGQLKNALGLSSVKQDKDGNLNIKIGFSEKRNDGAVNARIANIIEYGKHNQPAKPFLKSAKKQSENECIEAMKQTFNEEINKL